MKIIGNSLQKSFLVKHSGKTYYVNYLDADYPSPTLLNRDKWEVIDEDGEEIGPYIIKSVKNTNNKKTNLYYKLIEFCVKNFNKYKSESVVN